MPDDRAEPVVLSPAFCFAGGLPVRECCRFEAPEVRAASSIRSFKSKAALEACFIRHSLCAPDDFEGGLYSLLGSDLRRGNADPYLLFDTRIGHARARSPCHSVLMPPSMMGSASVVKADSSEARKTTASAISFGEPRPSGIWRRLAFQDRRRRGDRPRQGLALRQAIAGLDITLLPMFLAGGAIKSKRLRVIEIGVQAEVEYIADPEARRPSAKLTALADHLRTAFGTPPYWEAGG
jgi:hypothetical protein